MFPLEFGAVPLQGSQIARIERLRFHWRQKETCPITRFFTEPEVRLKLGTLAFDTK